MIWVNAEMVARHKQRFSFIFKIFDFKVYSVNSLNFQVSELTKVLYGLLGNQE